VALLALAGADVAGRGHRGLVGGLGGGAGLGRAAALGLRAPEVGDGLGHGRLGDIARLALSARVSASAAAAASASLRACSSASRRAFSSASRRVCSSASRRARSSSSRKVRLPVAITSPIARVMMLQARMPSSLPGIT
jgi:hypothetical protein